MLRINSTRTHEERGADPNQTPPAVVRALAHHEHLPQWILDPAVGLGHVLDTFRALGHNVIGRDVVDYGWAGTTIADYLTTLSPTTHDMGIVTNPPFRLAMEFLEKAFADDTQYVAFLLRLNFLESMRRKPFFERHPPTRLWVSSRRFEMHHIDWTGPLAPSNTAYAWHVWDRREIYNGAQLGWFDHKDFA